MKDLNLFKTSLGLALSLSLLAPVLALGAAATAKKAPPETINMYDEDNYRLPSPYMVDGFNFGFEYMVPNKSQADIKNKMNGSLRVDVSAELNNDHKQWGLKGGYKQIPRGGLGFDLNLAYLMEDRAPEGQTKLSYLVPSVNAVLAAPQYFYGSAGINVLTVFGSSDTNYTPRLGYQVGAGLLIATNLNFEIFFNWLNTAAETKNEILEMRNTATSARLLYAF